MLTHRNLTRVAVVAVMAAALAATPPAAAAPARPVGDIRVFATLPYPGTPGGVVVDGQTAYVDTSAANIDRPFDGRDLIYAYNVDSERQRGEPVSVDRQFDVAPMGLAGMALDSAGRIYAADMNGRVDRIDPRTGAQETYATIPTGTDTSTPDMPTFVVFDRDGNLYVSDAGGSPVIWRVPPGGGTAQPWFADPRLAGTWAASVLGLTLDPTGQDLYFVSGNQPTGIAVYRLPLASPDAAHLEEFHRYTDLVVTPCAPDPTPALASCTIPQALSGTGLAFGRSGNLYVVLFAKNQLSILGPDGNEVRRFPSTEDNAELEVPLCGPFDLAFDGKGSLLVTNNGDATNGYGADGNPSPYAGGDAKNWVVFDVWVDDTAAGVPRPTIGAAS